MTLVVAPIVEGHAEVECIPTLLSRVWQFLRATEPIHFVVPTLGKRDKLIHPKFPDLANKIAEACKKLSQRLMQIKSPTLGMVLILLDAEKDCSKELGPRLLEAARKARSDTDIACVIAEKMFENWIVAGASTLAGINGLPDPLPPRDQFEERSGVAWLEKQL